MTQQAIKKAKAEHDALGWSPSNASTSCPTCDEAATLVSETRLPEIGPLPVDGYEIHRDDGNAYYHRTEDEVD